MAFLQLNSGHQIPTIGLGTWRAPNEEVEQAVTHAFELGYRHIDTAASYKNEGAIGKVLSAWLNYDKMKRSDLFVCTKLPATGNRPQDVEKCLMKSLSELRLKWVDLYLVHVPFTVPDTDGPLLTDENGEFLVDADSKLEDVWRKMEEMVDAGLAKSIGISNFNLSQLQRILNICRIRPAVHQIEVHIYLQQHDMVEFCQKEGIVVTAYAPFGSRGIEELYKRFGTERSLPDILANPEVLKIAARVKRSPAQVVLRNLLQRGVVVIPKSTNPERLRENFAVTDFELSENDMRTLKGLDRNFRICDCSFFRGLEKHPEFPWKIDVASQEYQFPQMTL